MESVAKMQLTAYPWQETLVLHPGSGLEPV